MDNILEQIAKSFSLQREVKAVVLAGSSQNSINDSDSDYDIYVYCSKPISLSFRTRLASKFSDEYEINNQFWEDGDEWVIENGPNIDIMYRDEQLPQSNINWVFKTHKANVGFTTCILYNIQKSHVLFDRSHWFKSMQSELNMPYSDGLTKAIIKKNYPVLSRNISSYKTQIEKAVKRGDLVNINNRITAFLNSYFDIIFAINKQFHPGEKRLIALAKTTCQLLPSNFEENVNNLLTDNQNQLIHLSRILSELDKIMLLQDTI